MKSLVAPAKPGEKEYNQLVQVLTQHFDPAPSKIVRRYRFNTRVRRKGESVAAYVSELRGLAQFCNYGDSLETMLRDRLVCGINDESIQRRLLAETALTFKKALELAQGMETAAKNVQEMQGTPQQSAGQSAEEVHAVSKKTFVCYRCGQSGHGPAHCTFRTAQCHKSSATPPSALLLKYKSISNKVRRLTRLDTKQYTEHICQQYFRNPKKFWSWVNSSKGTRKPIPTLMHNGVSVANDSDKADVFNNYFHSVLTQEDLTNFDLLKQSSLPPSPVISTVDFSPSVVCHYLKSLDVTKACGPDLLPGFLLRYCAEDISSPLSYLFNKSMSTGSLPQDWVSANVVPVFKRDDRHVPSNYWPISLTSIVVKTMERIIHSRLVSALESHNLIGVHQFGFRKRHSTTHLLLEAVHDWAKALECRDSCHCLCLDFAKAFDSVPHRRLLLKLRTLGINGQLLAWIDCFLTTRSQRVVINGQYSRWLPVVSGVPQGSILGPLLFILYIDDVKHAVQHSSIKVFADDISLYSQVSTNDDCSKLQADLSCVYQWSLSGSLN